MASAGSSSITSTRARLSAALARQALGSSNQNVLPTPSVLSKPMRPPWAVTISWQSASPRPVPPISRVSEESTRKNRVKTCACWSGRDAEARVAHLHAGEALARDGRDRHGAAGGRVLDRVGEQVGDHLPDAVAVADHRQRLVAACRTRAGGSSACAAKSSTSCSSSAAELERLEREREAPGLDLLHVEEVVDERRQALRLAVDRLQVAPARVLVEVVVHQQLREAEHARERCAQLVRDGGDELGLEPRGLALGGDLADHDDAADQLAGGVVHGARVALEGAADIGELEVVLRRAVGIGRDRLHRGEVGRRVGEAVGDRRALLQRGVLGDAEDLRS